MLKKIKSLYWYFFNKKKYRNYIILNWIKKTKEYYCNEHMPGMCYSFANTLPKYLKKEWNLTEPSYKKIKHFIPEYYPEFFETHEIEYDEELNNSAEEGYWWHIPDREPRIKAFDKLIEIYEQKL